jgi:hypothetical protein
MPKPTLENIQISPLAIPFITLPEPHITPLTTQVPSVPFSPTQTAQKSHYGSDVGVGMVTGHLNVMHQTQADTNAISLPHTKMGDLSNSLIGDPFAGGSTLPHVLPWTWATLFTSVPSAGLSPPSVKLHLKLTINGW